MRKLNIAFGFYQELSTAQSVLNRLKRQLLWHVVSIYHQKDGCIEIKRHIPSSFYLLFSAAALGMVFAIFLALPSLIITFLALSLLFGVFIYWKYYIAIDRKLIERFKNLVFIDEILVIVQIPQKDVREVLAILRQVKSGHPVSFLMRSDMMMEDHVDIPSEPLTLEQMCQEAEKLALLLKQCGSVYKYDNKLLARLNKSDRMLQFLRKDIYDAEYIEQTIPMSAEWLLDNMYIIEGSIEDVKRNLPKKYYKELPKILHGSLAGLPRIYAIAVELVKCTAGRLNKENITEFLKSYQKVYSLTIGELWAFPLMLRLRLIEWIQFLSIHLDNRMREGELASFWGNRLLSAARHEPNKLSVVIEHLSEEQVKPSPHFAEELLEHLFDEESVIPFVRKWLENFFTSPLNEVLHQEQIYETSEQVIFSSSVMSLITLSQLVWPQIFEEVSLINESLKKDPAGIYSQMDFSTRNKYREVIEEIARHSNYTEEEVSYQVLELAEKGKHETEQHVGYYLIDDGRLILEKKLNYHLNFINHLRQTIISHSTLVYLGGIILITAFFELYLFGLLFHSLSYGQGLLFFLLSLMPVCEISLQIVNFVLTLLLKATMLPRMSYEKGIPNDCKTLVVIPMMLLTFDSIKEELHRLEIRFLANMDANLCFALFSDFSDATEQTTENDFALLTKAEDGIKDLEKKYGNDKFFLFNRKRVWSNTENAWIGWERKRGKLDCLNRYLTGELLPENVLIAGNEQALKNIHYVITLDADTQLPKDQARALIEVISHPLNRPYLDAEEKKIVRGYTIIQPRVATDFIRSKATWFCRIFSEPAALDPYTQAVSHVYQDLFKEGSYHGKGIYDVKAFHRLLSNRFPEEHLLSHDLIEGAFARVGFASQVKLFDCHPLDYLSWIKRNHRWTRGDWQIIDWLMPDVPAKQGGKEANTLSWSNRWKIFDNLRRAALPSALLALLISGWTFSANPVFWTLLVTVILMIPLFSFVLSRILHYSFPEIKTSLVELRIIILRTFITIALLPFEAYQSLDAFVRVAYRRLISHRYLLQWIPSDYIYNANTNRGLDSLLQLIWGPFFAIMTLAAVFLIHVPSLSLALPFCCFWILSPLIIYLINQPISTQMDHRISEDDKKLLRKIARKTWCYFHDFVGPKTHWLPPDNYQTALTVEVAQRTSPTNIGFWLLSILGAYDFHYITCDEVFEKIVLTIQELKKLERFEGHFLNWYNIQTLDPLFPRYISTVDSGNLLASMWTLKQGLLEILEAPIIPVDAFSGIIDTFDSFEEKEHRSFANFNNPSLELDVFVKEIGNLVNGLKDKTFDNFPNKECLKQIEEQLLAWDAVISRYFSWVEILTSLPTEQLKSLDFKAELWRLEALSLRPTLEMYANGDFLLTFDPLIELSQKTESSSEIKLWGKKLREALSKSQWFAGEKLEQVREIIRDIDQFSEEMKMQYLFNADRKLFAIGYNIDERKLDSSYYDLLASEARIASIVAIASENAPLEHWWALGRFYSIIKGRRVLLSWGGTMFEYLMPLVFNKYYADSLLGDACHAVVNCQIDYGKKRGIPWGISESAFSAIDSHKIYQYRSFGIPGVGLKRGLEEDLVVSPYSSVLALAVDPYASIKNLRNLGDKNYFNLLGKYGFYESIDFTRQKSPKGERGVTVYTYMAHHQGMILASINNLLNTDILIKRFHNDPRICGVDSLLYERIPSSPAIKVKGIKKEHTLTRLKPFSQNPIMGVVETPESVTPKINLLSNENYSLMITNTGGGYSRWNDLDITRWRADTTRDAWGSFYYIKDLKSGAIWSTTFQPTLKKGDEYSVNFKGDKAEFKRKDYEIESICEVVVSPEDNAEIRFITLVNHSQESRYMELTSYMELALAPHRTDSVHPCFNKLFIETEALPESGGLLAFRRLRSPEESPIWAVHVITAGQQFEENLQYETDRQLFVGRGKSLKNPLAMEGDLSNTAGTVLDPIFSLRGRFIIEPGRRLHLSFVTAITDNRSSAIALVEKYKDISASYRAIELAWTYSQLEYRRLRIHQEEVQLFQKLASRILYPHSQLRTTEERLRSNQLGQSELWSQGISGDLPIVVVTVGDMYDTDLVKQVLIAHAFWSLRGLKVDLVILNEEETSYFHPLQEQLQNLTQAYSHNNRIDVPGGVFLKNSDQLPPQELNLILVSARAILVAARGSLRQQLVSPRQKLRQAPKWEFNKKRQESSSRSLPFLELAYFNGLGGYTSDGSSYVIYLGPNVNTPAPWINVIANPSFGIMVSEAGLGCCWYGNSQSNRLTPWSNDPLLDPIYDAIYIRDEKEGTVWTPTPSPIREPDPYRIRHGQGYTQFEHNSHDIEQELLVFVPVDDEGGLPLRIQRLRLSNHSLQRKRLSLTSYLEWILGQEKEETQMHVITEWDSESQAMLAFNRYHADFGQYVAFSFSLNTVSSYTGDRTEFIGRNRSTSFPEGLTRLSLSGHTGANLDPCSALQIQIEINPGNQIEAVFVLGYAKDVLSARQLIMKCRESGKIDQLFRETQVWWAKTLNTITIDTPDLATNFLMNHWLLYQNLSCRFWGRSGFYQSSGAYGFRDQLQDSMALAYTHPHLARDHILLSASRQFVEGDVQHWWHPQSGGGIRTRFSDDLLWLPFTTAHYVRVTGDHSILEVEIPFLEGDKLEENQHEIFQTPRISNDKATLLEHCRRAIQKGNTTGPHGLPLIGCGDWNDGMNRVGIKGKGESVWLGWFLVHVMNDFAELLTCSGGLKESGEGYRIEAKRLAEIIESTSWDGSWYRRAYFDDGTPLGSKENSEATIDSLAQSWAVICGLSNPERTAIALDSAEKYLVKAKENLVLLLTPPFDKAPFDPGYIKGYPPGVRENGGQYTHGSLWLAMAYAKMGKGSKAVDLLKKMSPTLHTQNANENALYRVEPYVLAGDIYDLKGQVGRGGWTWYTGSASWMYRIWLEEVLGFTLRGNKLTFNCNIPKDWTKIKLNYRHKSTPYEIVIDNPSQLETGVSIVKLDGKILDSREIKLQDDRKQHYVEITLAGK
jgi:cyclic beta-1,2-glucan synthetase